MILIILYLLFGCASFIPVDLELDKEGRSAETLTHFITVIILWPFFLVYLIGKNKQR